MGDVSQRRHLTIELIKQGFLELTLRDLRHRLFVIRQMAILSLLNLTISAFLGEEIPSSAAADIVEALATYSLEGSEYVVRQVVADTATAWQGELFDGQDGADQKQLRRLATRAYAQGQDDAMSITYHLMIASSPPQPRLFCVDIIKRKPHLFDLLLDCACLDRPKWFTQSEIASTVCEALALLLRWPSQLVPGVTSPLDSISKTRRWKDMLHMVTALTSRSDWAEKITEVWTNAHEESKEVIRGCYESELRYFGHMMDSEKNVLAAVFEQCGKCGGSILRVIATLSHVAESCGITNAQIESFLHICYFGCHELRPSGDGSNGLNAALFSMVQGDGDFVRGDLRDDPFAIVGQRILGPIALVRLLAVLAQRNALSGIQTLRKAPQGLSASTSLEHIQQITHPDIIRRIIKVSHLRMNERMRKGSKYSTNEEGCEDFPYACVAFQSVAELAAALLALDMYTGGVYTDAIRDSRKQLVVALGNASQMALNLRRYEQALGLARRSVNEAEKASVEENIEPSITEKNKCRMNQANAGLGL